MTRINLPNIGIIEQKLSSETISRLKDYIKNKKEKTNHTLAGNIKESNTLVDKDDWFFKNILLPSIDEYNNLYTDIAVPHFLTKNCQYILNSFWVNFQKKYEFNPIHNHGGLFSFVIWIKIPSSFKKECELPFVKHSNSKYPNSFQLFYTNALGQVSTCDYNLEPSHEGTMLFFPSKFSHCVYPFYLSNKKRISISGNIYLNPEKITDDV